MDPPVAELPLPMAARAVAPGVKDRAPRFDDVACWFDIGARNGILQPPVQARPSGNAARAIRHLLSRRLPAAGAAGAREKADDDYRAPSLNPNPARSTIPGSTSFKALCNSYLRKLLRGVAPDSLYWVAHANLPDGNHVFARLRMTFVVEDLCIEKIAATAPPPATHRLTVAPEQPGPHQLKTEWIRELG